MLIYGSQLVDLVGVTAFVAGRLIALDKNPGARPIVVEEVSRRIIGKAILKVSGSVIQTKPVHVSFVRGNWLGVRLQYTLLALCFLIQNVMVFCWWMHQMLSIV